MENSLQKYYRQPKIYLSLPSKGMYYPENGIDGDPKNLPVFGMTAMDEIIFKTPDALFSGESTVSCIKSCIPAIKDPWQIPQIDLDSILIAIRIATYGQYLDSNYSCTECKAENGTQLDLTKTLDYFASLEYNPTVDCYPLTVSLRPFNYKEQTELQHQQYNLRRILLQSTGDKDMPEEDRNKKLDEFYNTLAKYQITAYKKQIATVEADDIRVADAQEINDFINNSDKGFFQKIKAHLEGQQDAWQVQSQTTNCSECSAENKVKFTLDNSDFFATKS